MGLGHYYIYCNSPNYAAAYPGAIQMALNVVLPELLLLRPYSPSAAPEPMAILLVPVVI